MSDERLLGVELYTDERGIHEHVEVSLLVGSKVRIFRWRVNNDPDVTDRRAAAADKRLADALELAREIAERR